MTRRIPYDVRAMLRPAKVLLVVPPFAHIDRPQLGVHLLQGLARRMGIEVQVLYANMLFAAYVDHGTFATLSSTSLGLCNAERIFARVAYGVPPLGYDRGAEMVAELQRRFPNFGLRTENLLKIESMVDGYLDSFVPAIADGGFDVVGCSSSFEQNASSIAILRALKRRRPEMITIMGGANCEGPMAEGLATLTRDVDYIFGGESEETFVAFLEQLQRGERPTERIAHGTPCENLDALPTPDFADYYAQLRAWLPTSRWMTDTHVNYETSRGCWWGQKSHCTFCGLNGQGMAMREKSADRAIAELKELLSHHPNRKVLLTDNIMPHAYWKTFLPRLPTELPGVTLMYELKANMTLDKVNQLADAGVHEFQPGIEALSTSLLKLMAKGTTCSQNLAVLRYARANKLHVVWNLLSGFPNDLLSFYEETLELLPLIVHLPPPKSRNVIVLDRFSPYHERPETYGITALRPQPPYAHFLPHGAPIDTIAYNFTGDYPSESNANPELMAAIDRAVAAWRLVFHADKPATLSVGALGQGRYELVDTRGLPGLPQHQIIDEAQAIAALIARPLTAAERPGDAWARTQRVVVERDKKLVPLAVASRELLGMFEGQFRTTELVVLPRGEEGASWNER